MHVSKTKTKRKMPPLTEEELRQGCKLGLDSHAEVHCIGRHARILEIFEGRQCTVHPFNDAYDPMTNVNTVNACFAYDTDDSQTYIIHVNQALNFSSTMEHSLLCVNQSRFHGVVVDDVPKFLDYYKRSSHSIYFPSDDIHLPLLMDGPTSYLPVRFPTDEELDYCPHLELSCGESPWDPMSMKDLHSHHVASATTFPMSQFACDLCDKIYVNATRRSPTKHSQLDVEALAKLWHIGLPAARDTLQSTTQDHVRNLNNGINHRVKTRAHQRQYKHIHTFVFK